MSTSAGGKGSRKHGRNKDKCAKYRQHNQRAKNKIKRILQSNGRSYAEEWAAKNGVKVPQ